MADAGNEAGGPDSHGGRVAEERRTARILLLDPDLRILLMRLTLEAEPEPANTEHELWVTLGGRIEPGESVLIAAQRELREETGITDARLGPVVWYGEQILMIGGRPRSLKETFVVARSAGQTLTDSFWTAEERHAVAEMRWWSLDELATTSRTVKPPGLATLLSELLDSLSNDGDDAVPVRMIDLQ
ncbi:MAG TPA: NUDIX domain-containing protein [Frankiaceae bacterium]|nr:NUDIX domain-containing protein [Frankiaceae bacterium]